MACTGRVPTPPAGTRFQNDPPHPKSRKCLHIELVSDDRSIFITCPLHPNTSPHVEAWTRIKASRYVVRKFESTTPQDGIHMRIALNGHVRSIQEAIPGQASRVQMRKT